MSAPVDCSPSQLQITAQNIVNF